jgi:hypothetical protein
LALLDSLGVNFNPRTLWNAIPWSFVIDWFVKIGDWLNTFEVKWMKPTIQIMDLMCSVKRSRKISVSFTGWDDRLITDGRIYVYPAVKETAFKRFPITLDEASVTLSGLSLTEFSLGAALATSVADRRHKQRIKRHLKRPKKGQSGKTKHAK